MAQTSITWTNFVWQILPAVDRGRTLSVDETVRRIEDGSLFEWLADELGDDYFPALVEHDPERKAALLEEFGALVGAYGPSNWGVERNGLAYLVALAVEKAQQALMEP